MTHVDTMLSYGFVMKINEENNHLFLGKLCNIVPYEFRYRLYYMHLDKHIMEAEIKSQGFNVVKVYK